MSLLHTVTQGEHLSGIAAKYGFSNFLTVWDHPSNAELRKNRQNPNVLFPGDVVFIPTKESKEISGSTEKRHRFGLVRKKITLRLLLEDTYHKPIANTKCELAFDQMVHHLTTDAKGRIELEIPPSVRNAELSLRDATSPLNQKALKLRIGDLDPVDNKSGQVARLVNLGYYSGPFDPVDERLFLIAVEEFQCEHKLPVDGKCGPVTQAKLKEVHGC
ncbi:MAG: peptidoglycan-binding protein [Acidobacteriota bacterium]